MVRTGRAPIPLRILFYTGIDLTLAEGHATHARRLVDAFESRGHRVRCLALTPRGPISWSGPPDGIRSIARPEIPRLGHWIAQLRAGRALLEETRRYRPDLVLARMEPMTAAPLALPRSVPLFVESNASTLGHARLRGDAGLKQRVEQTLERALLRRAVRVGVAAPGLADLHHARHGIDRARMLFVPNGTYLPPFEAAAALRARRGLGYDDSDFVIGFIGNLARWQGLELLLEAMGESRLAQVRLWIMGDGNLRDTLDRKVAERGLQDRIRLLGPRPEEEAAILAQATQILVAPYEEETMRVRFGSGVPTMKALFAMACDRPLLAGATPLIESLGAGEVVASDPRSWTDALERWAGRWRESGAPLIGWPWPEGAGPGRRYVGAERTWDQTARVWESAFFLTDSRSR